MTFDTLSPFSTIAQDDFMSMLGRGTEELHYAPCGFNHSVSSNAASTHFLKRNWITSMIMKNERKRHAGKKKITSLEIYLYLPYDVILEVRKFYLY
jgi:hypothetical protein